ncbi:hypothetical protein [Adhaeribacter aquaticus]|uniref:hypothetical protein n=1 Tax=Adhaeribacter aquaticus TaxID=299567 RepID=UPI000421CD03|nr:hypothetical protein [Adhaeribacter aquaticus]
MKNRFVATMTKENQDFTVDAVSSVDIYVFHLQAIEKEMGLSNLPLDQKVATNDEAVRAKFSQALDKLHRLDPEHYPEEGPEK